MIANFGPQIFERHRKLVIEAVRLASQRTGADGAPLIGAANASKMSGWLVKKGQKRWFELVGADVHYYVGVDAKGCGEDFRGVITISSSSVITTAGKVLTIRNTDRVRIPTHTLTHTHTHTHTHTRTHTYTHEHEHEHTLHLETFIKVTNSHLHALAFVRLFVCNGANK
jgi:hypothetical protein